MMIMKVENVDMSCYTLSKIKLNLGGNYLWSFKNSFQTKLILFLFLAISIPITISIIVTYQYTKTTVKNTYINNNSTLLYHGSQNLQHYLSQLNQASLFIYSDMRDEKSFHQIVSSESIGYVDDSNLFVNLQLMSNSFSDITQVYLYLKRSNTSHRYAYNIKRQTNGKSYSIAVPEGVNYWIEPTHLSHTYNINKFPFEKHSNVISLHKNILNLPSDEILGTFTIDVKLSTITQMSELLYNQEEEQLFILNEQGNPIYSSHTIDETVLTDWLAQIQLVDKQSNYFEYADNSFKGIHLYEKVSSPIGNWTIIKRIPYDYLYSDARHLTFINSLIVILFLAIAIIIVFFISYYFTSPIKRMLKYINQIEIGQVNSKLDIKRTDEIGILSRRFHQLINKLNNAINNEYRLVLANRTNQLKALQAQINPHFLNNALQSIGTLALQQNQKKIYSLITSLGRMMRYQMNTNDLPVNLSVELEYVTNYLQLQSQRFENQLMYRFDITDEASKINIPRMLLQPLVENCFKHGFVKHHNNGEIIIKAMVEQEMLHISIIDNGIGLLPERLAELQQQLSLYHINELGTHTSSESIGLFNTLARLHLHYSKLATLRLIHNEPNGLIVQLSIPIESEVVR